MRCLISCPGCLLQMKAQAICMRGNWIACSEGKGGRVTLYSQLASLRVWLEKPSSSTECQGFAHSLMLFPPIHSHMFRSSLALEWVGFKTLLVWMWWPWPILPHPENLKTIVKGGEKAHLKNARLEWLLLLHCKRCSESDYILWWVDRWRSVAGRLQLGSMCLADGQWTVMMMEIRITKGYTWKV